MPVDVKMPQLGESVTEGTIGRWLKQPGETIAEFEPLLEVTTDKVDTEVPATISGTVLELLVPEGETVRVGTIIARLLDVNEVVSNGASPTAPTNAALASIPPANDGAASTPLPSKAPNTPISPVVARLVAEHNIDLSEIQGTGNGGRISKKDVETFLAQRNAIARTIPTAVPERPTTMLDGDAALEPEEIVDPVPAPAAPIAPAPISSPRPAGGVASLSVAPPLPSPSPIPHPPSPRLGPDDELLPLSSMRRTIAQHMVNSKRTAPHVTTVMEADLSRIVLHRNKHKNDYERQGVRLTYTAYFVEATVRALREVPIVNASFSDGGIVQHHRVNVGVATAITDGLIVPVIKDADDKSLLGLARAVNDLSERARSRRLQPDDTQGGTFTITNHGVSGSIFAMPIINQPQSAILGVGAMQKRAVVVTEGGLDAIAIRPMCYLSLTFDHRLIDGATGDAFLAVVKRALEEYSG